VCLLGGPASSCCSKACGRCGSPGGTSPGSIAASGASTKVRCAAVGGQLQRSATPDRRLVAVAHHHQSRSRSRCGPPAPAAGGRNALQALQPNRSPRIGPDVAFWQGGGRWRPLHQQHRMGRNAAARRTTHRRRAEQRRPTQAFSNGSGPPIQDSTLNSATAQGRSRGTGSGFAPRRWPLSRRAQVP